MGAELQVAIPGLHVGFPGGTLDGRSGSGATSRQPNHPTSIPTGVFETSDGHINIASAGQAIYERFCKAVDAEHLITASGVRGRSRAVEGSGMP